MNKLLILTSYSKFELNSLTNNDITMKLPITDIFGCRDTAEVRNDVIFKNGYDVINCFTKFAKFLPHSIIDWRLFAPPPYKMGSQNTPYKLGLTFLGVRVRDKMAISAYILEIVEKNLFLKLPMRAKEDFSRHQLFPQISNR